MGLLLVGAGHVFRIEEPIRAIIHRERPGAVALELDPARFQGLLERARGTYNAAEASRHAPRIYRTLAKYQEDLAASLGTQVGGEMLAAARAASDVGSKVVLIDRNAQALVAELWQGMSLREKGRLFLSALWARMPWRRGGGGVEKELKRYHEDPVAYLDELGRSFPTLKRVLLDERNEHMATELRRLAGEHEQVVAILGDGHVDGIKGLLDDLQPRVVRLAELRAYTPAGDVAWRRDPAGSEVGFTFDQPFPDDPYARGD